MMSPMYMKQEVYFDYLSPKLYNALWHINDGNYFLIFAARQLSNLMLHAKINFDDASILKILPPLKCIPSVTTNEVIFMHSYIYYMSYTTSYSVE